MPNINDYYSKNIETAPGHQNVNFFRAIQGSSSESLRNYEIYLSTDSNRLRGLFSGRDTVINIEIINKSTGESKEGVW